MPPKIELNEEESRSGQDIYSFPPDNAGPNEE